MVRVEFLKMGLDYEVATAIGEVIDTARDRGIGDIFLIEFEHHLLPETAALAAGESRRRWWCISSSVTELSLLEQIAEVAR